jgi:hypothetical protein
MVMLSFASAPDSLLQAKLDETDCIQSPTRPKHISAPRPPKCRGKATWSHPRQRRHVLQCTWRLNCKDRDGQHFTTLHAQNGLPHKNCLLFRKPHSSERGPVRHSMTHGPGAQHLTSDLEPQTKDTTRHDSLHIFSQHGIAPDLYLDYNPNLSPPRPCATHVLRINRIANRSRSPATTFLMLPATNTHETSLPRPVRL